VSEISEWLDERYQVYRLSYESAQAHFKDREYTQDEFVEYQKTYVSTYFNEPKRPLRRWDDYTR
jgi:hypothetical protein